MEVILALIFLKIPAYDVVLIPEYLFADGALARIFLIGWITEGAPENMAGAFPDHRFELAFGINRDQTAFYRLSLEQAMSTKGTGSRCPWRIFGHPGSFLPVPTFFLTLEKANQENKNQGKKSNDYYCFHRASLE